IKAYEATSLVEAEKTGLASFHSHWDAYRTAYHAVLGAAGPAATKAYFASAAGTYASVDGDLAGLSKVQQTPSKQLTGDIADKYASSRTMTLAALIVALLLGAGIAFFVARGIKVGVQRLIERFRSLDEHDLASLAHGLGAVSGGDLTVVVDSRTA